MRYLSRSIILAVVIGAPIQANAGYIQVTLDFDSATPGAFTTLTEDGFTISQFGIGDSQVVGGSGNQYLLDGNISNFNGAASIITAPGGVLFDLVSLDIADLTNNAGGGGGAVGTGWRIEVGDSVFNPTNAAVYSPTSSSFTTVSPLGLTGLSSLSINIVSNGALTCGFFGCATLDNFAVDNIVLRYQSISVPEPGTLGLFGAGLGALGLVRRRRRRT